MKDALRALIVSDDAKNALHLRDLMEPDGIEVGIIRDPWQARAEVLGKSPDVVFVELHTDRIDGIRFARELRREGVDEPTIILLAAPFEMDLLPFDAMEEVGIRRVLFKPVRHAELMACLGEILESVERRHEGASAT